MLIKVAIVDTDGHALVELNDRFYYTTETARALAFFVVYKREPLGRELENWTEVLEPIKVTRAQADSFFSLLDKKNS